MFSKMLHASLLVFASLAVAIAADPSLSLKVSGPAAVDGVDNLKIVTTLTNTGAETVKVLNDPNGPLSKLPTNTFTITDASGTTPAFNGVKAKYVPKVAAAASAFTILAPGQSIDVEHNLSEAYNFTTSGAGTYDIHPNNLFYLVGDDSSIETVHADTASSHSSKVSGKLAVSRSSAVEKRATYKGCSSSQQSSLVSAASAAQSYAASAYSYANSISTGTTRYVTWFGTYTASRHSTIVSHYQKISGNTFSSNTYDCTCTESGTYAYVYPDTFGTIYLCGAFWSAPTTGTDSKGGTLIHESSHFTVNGGTDDYVYGQSAAKSLAKSNPGEAVFNADNHEYFAENNPAQS
ncbi:peptidyl-Lys metalloendopeptidase [Crepidotus variabilis]|uniref:Peptidyl-Lys metalloendopeptidase n=1 Tax=Crepidotus variabilis TaxID=179855 RepID=A0A9P6E5Y0_9AGAR|nr:peptidyl-Lys metalloendopeptidase [Crepidotus variabilis]